jgi:hypothetical protein
MKMKNLLLILMTGVGVLLSSCEVDNYAEPDGIIRGTVYDAITGEPIISEQPNGFRISCNGVKWQGSLTEGGQSFWGKADGTFNSEKIFAGVYRVYLSGPFHTTTADTVEIKSKKVSVHDFTVTPFVGFEDVSIVKDPDVAGGIIATFTVHTYPEYAADTVKTEANIRNYQLFASSRTRHVGINAYDGEVSTGEIALTAERLGQAIIVKKTGFRAGKTYYLRLGARCWESPEARYNFTQLVRLDF